MEDPDLRWICSFLAPPQLVEPDNHPPPPGLRDNTLRQHVCSSLAGRAVRVLFSNEHSATPLELRAVELCAGDATGALTFDGRTACELPPGATRCSDPLELAIPAGEPLTLTARFGAVPQALTGHPGSRTTSYLGPAATPTDHWYVLAGLEVLAAAQCRGIVAFGDSLTDGRGSTTNGNDRWPDRLAARLRRHARTEVAVLNAGIGGNALVRGGLGPTGLTRFERDVLTPRGVRWVIVLLGVNDLGTRRDPDVVGELVRGYEQLASAAHARGLLVYGVPLLPFAGSQYTEREPARQQVNAWIRSAGCFDAVLPLDAAVAEPGAPERLAPEYDSGDHLHLNPAGYQRMADAIDLERFAEP